jgi:transcriptional regulator with XRE-family HTH domain
MELREARERAGLSLDGLAEKVGLHRQTIYQIEIGERYPSRETVLRFAEVLGCPELEERYLTKEDVTEIRGIPALVAAVKRMLRKMRIS